MKPGKVLASILLLTVCLVLVSSCSFFGGLNEKKVVAYLTAVGPDFEKSKEDLEVFGEEYGEDLGGVAKLLEAFKKSKADFQTRMENVKKQEVPPKPEELAAFHNSLTVYYSDTIKLMGEYEQVISYSRELMESTIPIEKAMNEDLGKAPSMEEIKTMAKSIKTSIDESISSVEKSTPPYYLSDSHAGYLNTLKRFSGATDDYIYALQLSDPLRIYAANYRYVLIANKLKALSDEMNKELEKQQEKMDENGEQLQKVQDSLYKQLLLWQGQYKIGN